MVATLHNKLTFDFDEILIRYLSELDNEYDRRHQPDVEVPEDGFLKRNCILILRFEKGEIIDHETNNRFLNFVSYFEKKKILHFLDYQEYWQRYLKKPNLQPIQFFQLKDPYAEFEYSPYILVEVLDIKALKNFREKYVLGREVILPASKIRTADEVVYEKGIIQYGLEIRYKLRSKNRVALMQELWQYRDKGGKSRNGVVKAKDLLASRIYNTDSRKDVSKQQLKKVDRLIINLNSYFEDKELPLEIKKYNDSVQIRVIKGLKK